MKTLTAKDALKHPNWDMGAKITIDCATLVNKGFEVIEAHYLYGVPYEKIDVIIHKESIIHSMVEYLDGSTIAQMSYPSMEIPISLALSVPNRIQTDVKGLNFSEIGKLTFSKPDTDRFPCLDLVVEAGKRQKGYPAVINGANERAVKLFLDGKIGYLDIYESLKGAFDEFKGIEINSYVDLKKADDFGRRFVDQKFGV
jgi:1-deoxy-D-xylulose-5-phosphate reductoisomerase